MRLIYPKLNWQNKQTKYCCSINSLAPGKYEWNFRYVIFKWILMIDERGISCEITLIWMSPDFTDDQSTLVLVMACCLTAPSHYVSQCWPSSLAPYGVTRPQWVDLHKIPSVLLISWISCPDSQTRFMVLLLDTWQDCIIWVRQLIPWR